MVLPVAKTVVSSRFMPSVVILLAGAAALTVTACSHADPRSTRAGSSSDDDSGPPVFSEDFLKPAFLTGKLVVSAPILGRPDGIVVQRNQMWLSDDVGDPYVDLIDIVSGTISKSVGRKGEGPGDFSSLMNLSLRPGDTSGAWGFDLRLRRLTRMPVADADTVRTIASPAGISTLRMLWLSRDRLLAVTYDDSTRFMLMDGTGKLLATVPGQLLGGDSIPEEVRAPISTPIEVCVRPDGKTFSVVNGGGGRIDYYDSNAALLGRAKVPFPSGEIIRRDRAGRWYSLLRREYYRHCAATQAHLYALFSGRLQSAFPDGRQTFGQFVHVFDWSGHLEAVFQLDREVDALSVIGDTLLYGAGDDPPGVYGFRIPAR